MGAGYSTRTPELFLARPTLMIPCSVLYADLLQGLIDIEKELSKLEGKKDKLGGQLTRLQEATKVPDYETKVFTNKT